MALINAMLLAMRLVRGREPSAYENAGYQGANKPQNARQDIRWYVAMRPGKRRSLSKANAIDIVAEKIEKLKASVRAKVEHPFRVIKRKSDMSKCATEG